MVCRPRYTVSAPKDLSSVMRFIFIGGNGIEQFSACEGCLGSFLSNKAFLREGFCRAFLVMEVVHGLALASMLNACVNFWVNWCIIPRPALGKFPSEKDAMTCPDLCTYRS